MIAGSARFAPIQSAAGAARAFNGLPVGIGLRSRYSARVTDLERWYDESSGVEEIGMYSREPPSAAAIQLEVCIFDLRASRSSYIWAGFIVGGGMAGILKKRSAVEAETKAAASRGGTR